MADIHDGAAGGAATAIIVEAFLVDAMHNKRRYFSSSEQVTQPRDD